MIIIKLVIKNNILINYLFIYFFLKIIIILNNKFYLNKKLKIKINRLIIQKETL